MGNEQSGQTGQTGQSGQTENFGSPFSKILSDVAKQQQQQQQQQNNAFKTILDVTKQQQQQQQNNNPFRALINAPQAKAEAENIKTLGPVFENVKVAGNVDITPQNNNASAPISSIATPVLGEKITGNITLNPQTPSTSMGTLGEKIMGNYNITKPIPVSTTTTGSISAPSPMQVMPSVATSIKSKGFVIVNKLSPQTTMRVELGSYDSSSELVRKLNEFVDKETLLLVPKNVSALVKYENGKSRLVTNNRDDAVFGVRMGKIESIVVSDYDDGQLLEKFNIDKDGMSLGWFDVLLVLILLLLLYYYLTCKKE